MDQYRATAVYRERTCKVLIEVFGITVFQRICVICSNMVCISCIWFVGNVSGGYCDLAGNDRSSSGYAAASGRHGNQRAVVPSNILTDIRSQLLLPGMILSRGLGYYTELFISAIFTIVANFTIGRREED